MAMQAQTLTQKNKWDHLEKKLKISYPKRSFLMSDILKDDEKK